MKKSAIFLIVVVLMSVFRIDIQAQTKGKVSLGDLWKQYTFYPKGVYGIRSMNDGLHYTTLGRGADNSQVIVKYSYKTGDVVDTLLTTKTIDYEGFDGFSDYQLSGDEKKILLITNQEPIYRRSFKADYYIYDIATKLLTPLSENGKQQLATFSPDGTMIAFVRDNNIYIYDVNSKNEKQITFDGKFNHIINGAPDWVYEEEFGFSQGFHWSPDSKKIAYQKFDESKVKEFGMTMFQGLVPSYDANALYPENNVWKYPKAGDDNSVVGVFVYNLLDNKTIEIEVGKHNDQYIPRVRWTVDPEVLSVFRMNRHQNKFELLLANVDDNKVKVVFTEENKYYISESVLDNLTFLEDNKHFIWTSERDGFNHIYLMNMDGTVARQLTQGAYDVTSYIGFDAKKKVIYYQAAEESPLRREIYSVNLKGKKKKRLTKGSGTNNATFSHGYKYFINTFSNATTPPIVTLHEAKNGKLIRELLNNNDLMEKLSAYDYSLKEFFTFETGNGDLLNGYMIKPVGFDPNQKYPVLMTQYSGPNSQSARDAWSFDWENYLAQEGFIVVCVDGRGTGARGEEFRKVTYLNLGKYESDDQIETAKYLGTLPYVDKDNIAIWGWSFGGFMVNLSMCKSDVFKAGIAVAPVTNWRYYDNIYTERYMRTPSENADGYDQNSPLTHAGNLSGNLLIIHGSADDNVHVQNTMEFIERLVQADKQFDMMIYTNRNHSIYGGNTRYHLYKKMTDFLFENLK